MDNPYKFSDGETYDNNGNRIDPKSYMESNVSVLPSKEVPSEIPKNMPIDDTPPIDDTLPIDDTPQNKSTGNTPFVKSVHTPYKVPFMDNSIIPIHTPIDKTSLTETIVADPTNVLSHIMPQKNKWWHFQFKHQADEDGFAETLKDALRSALGSASITVEFNYESKKESDVTIMDDNNVIGKIHFLHMDRPDKGNKNKYYVKLHLFNISSAQIFNTIKSAAINFFTSLKSHSKSYSIHRKQSHKQSHKQSFKQHKHPHKKYNTTHKNGRSKQGTQGKQGTQHTKHTLRTQRTQHKHPHKKYNTTHKKMHRKKRHHTKYPTHKKKHSIK